MDTPVIIFIHGLCGDIHSTWGRFPELMKVDPKMSQYDIEFYSYPSPVPLEFWKKYPKLQTIADGLKTFIQRKCCGRKQILLVGHSLGGLVARKYFLDLVANGDDRTCIAGILLFAVPNNGAALASISNYVPWKSWQVRQLCRDSDFIYQLNTEWVRLQVGLCGKFKFVVAGIDSIVDVNSAIAFWGNEQVEVAINCGHVDLVKPKSSQDISFLILKQFAEECFKESAGLLQQYCTCRESYRKCTGRGSSKYRIIAFDLDGTLLKGMDFSWTVVWDWLGFPKSVRKGGMRRYLKGDTTYSEWCAWACQQFKQKGLSKGDFKEIGKKISVTKNLHETIAVLKEDRFITAIISGGIDTLLYEKIPDADDLFDYICINKLQYNDGGVISGVEPTPFDFEGKITALEMICRANGVTMNEAVFVGEGFNDGPVAEKVGLCIAYPPKAEAVKGAAGAEIEEDNLSRILDYIM